MDTPSEDGTESVNNDEYIGGATGIGTAPGNELPGITQGLPMITAGAAGGATPVSADEIDNKPRAQRRKESWK